jgi:hypothetical protein
MTTMSQYYVGATPRRKSTTLYLTMQEKKEIFSEVGLPALHLLEFYLTKITRKNYIIKDQKAAESTGFSLRSVQDARRSLMKRNLFYECKTTNLATTIYLYCVGKEGVYSKKYFDSLFNCESVPEVYRKYNRKEFNNILANANLSKMEVDDINCLLDGFHKKTMGNKKQNSKW